MQGFYKIGAYLFKIKKLRNVKGNLYIPQVKKIKKLLARRERYKREDKRTEPRARAKRKNQTKTMQIARINLFK